MDEKVLSKKLYGSFILSPDYLCSIERIRYPNTAKYIIQRKELFDLFNFFNSQNNPNYLKFSNTTYPNCPISAIFAENQTTLKTFLTHTAIDSDNNNLPSKTIRSTTFTRKINQTTQTANNSNPDEIIEISTSQNLSIPTSISDRRFYVACQFNEHGNVVIQAHVYNPQAVARIVSSYLNIPIENVEILTDNVDKRIFPPPEYETFIVILCAVYAAKKFNCSIFFSYGANTFFPKIKVERKTSVRRDGAVVKENIKAQIDVGYTFFYEEETLERIFYALTPYRNIGETSIDVIIENTYSHPTDFYSDTALGQLLAFNSIHDFKIARTLNINPVLWIQNNVKHSIENRNKVPHKTDPQSISVISKLTSAASIYENENSFTKKNASIFSSPQLININTNKLFMFLSVPITYLGRKQNDEATVIATIKNKNNIVFSFSFLLPEEEENKYESYIASHLGISSIHIKFETKSKIVFKENNTFYQNDISNTIDDEIFTPNSGADIYFRRNMIISLAIEELLPKIKQSIKMGNQGVFIFTKNDLEKKLGELYYPYILIDADIAQSFLTRERYLKHLTIYTSRSTIDKSISPLEPLWSKIIKKLINKVNHNIDENDVGIDFINSPSTSPTISYLPSGFFEAILTMLESL